jgi:hypothetical protein
VDVKVRLLNAKLPTTGTHDLRHTDGSLLLAQGENPGSQVVSRSVAVAGVVSMAPRSLLTQSLNAITPHQALAGV